MGKIVGQAGSLDLVWQPVEEKENYEVKPAKLRIKIDLVPHPDRAKGLVNTYIPKSTSPKVNVITRLEFELTFYDVAFQHVSYSASKTNLHICIWLLVWVCVSV